MEERKFSVIIPAYNGAEFIGKTIQSVLNQTYTNFELIIVNDASPDQTDEIISQFSDNRIKYRCGIHSSIMRPQFQLKAYGTLSHNGSRRPRRTGGFAQ